jgi:hypothetical protein
MSKSILAVMVSQNRFHTFKETADSYDFKVGEWVANVIEAVVVILKADHSTDIYSALDYPLHHTLEMVKYKGSFHRDVYPRFKELLLQSTIVKPKEEPMKVYIVSEEFIKEAHEAACSTWKSKLEKQFPEAFPKTYKIGDRFNKVDNRYEYMLACTGNDNHVTMINISTGDRFSDEYQVNCIRNITETELTLLVEGEVSRRDFKLKE